MNRAQKISFFAALFAILICIVMLLPIFLQPLDTIAAEEKRIDMYLIGGQSNAAGYTKTESGTGVEKQTFDAVLYGGQVDKQRATGTTRQNMLDADDYTAVRDGLGMGSTYIGPEYGMAEYLSAYYTAENPAFIFKSAAGGTSLRDNNTGNGSVLYGNWYPRSLWPAERSGATGIQYENFVENFRTVYGKLVEMGYTPVVKAMIWMQGEDDRDYPELYKTLIKTFISDIRADLSEITGTDLSAMPFVMGEISPTFYSYTYRTVNETFNNALREVAADPAVTQVYTVNTEDLLTNTQGENGENVIIGSDAYHFNANDMRTLGNRFAQKAIEAINRHYIVSEVSGNGTMDVSEYNEESTQITLKFKPYDKHHKLTSLIINGEDKTADVQDNLYVIESPDDNYVVQAVFGLKTSYEISYSFDETKGTCDLEKSTTAVYEGDTIKVAVQPNEGYAVDSVTFEGTPLTYNSTTQYWHSEGVYQSGTVTVTFKEADAAVEPQEEGGCAGAILPTAGVSLLSTVGIVAAILIGKKKK